MKVIESKHDKINFRRANKKKCVFLFVMQAKLSQIIFKEN